MLYICQKEQRYKENISRISSTSFRAIKNMTPTKDMFVVEALSYAWSYVDLYAIELFCLDVVVCLTAVSR